MNTQSHVVMTMGITMKIMTMTLTSKVTPPVLIAHQVTCKRRGGGVLEPPMGEDWNNLGGDATGIGKALDVKENVAQESELQGKFFKNFIKVQAGQSLSDSISELENMQSGLKYFGSAIEYDIRKLGSDSSYS